MPSTITPASVRRIARRCAFIALACAASLPALAAYPQTDPSGRWALMGMVSEQTARLSVLAVPVARDVLPATCTVTVDFLDASGTKLIESSTLVLLPGKMQFVDLKGSLLRLANRTDRLQFSTEVHVLHNPPMYRQCNGAVGVVEMFDATGRSSLVVPSAGFYPPDVY